MVWKGERQRHSMANRRIRTRKDTCSEAKNLKMNDDVYQLRREAMKHIYEAKELCELPRVTIRITERPERAGTLGLARLNDNVIWIPENTIKKDYDLRHIVYHEILHAVFGIDHDPKCPLMNYQIPKQKLTKTQLDKLFVKWAKKSGGKCND